MHFALVSATKLKPYLNCPLWTMHAHVDACCATDRFKLLVTLLGDASDKPITWQQLFAFRDVDSECGGSECFRNSWSAVTSPLNHL